MGFLKIDPLGQIFINHTKLEGENSHIKTSTLTSANPNRQK